MKPYISELKSEIETKTEKLHDAFIKKVIKKHALPLLNKFQAKISFPVEVLYCNGDQWLSVREKTNDFHEALVVLAHPNSRISSNPNSYEEKIAELFPEMVELYQLYYEFDGYHGNPLLSDLKPTVKPQKNKKLALDKQLEYFSED